MNQNLFKSKFCIYTRLTETYCIRHDMLIDKKVT